MYCLNFKFVSAVTEKIEGRISYIVCIMLYMLVPLSLFIYFQYDVLEPVIFYWLIYSKSQAILKIYIFIKDVEPHQGRSLWTHLLGSKPRINDPTSQNHALGNPAKFLVGIEPRHLLLIPSLHLLGCILMDQPRHTTSSYMTNSWLWRITLESFVGPFAESFNFISMV